MKAIGQKVNFHKSEFMFNCSAHSDIKRFNCDTFGVKESLYTFKYLGLHVEWGQTKKLMYMFRLQSTNDKIQSWKSKFLTRREEK